MQLWLEAVSCLLPLIFMVAGVGLEPTTSGL